MARTVDTSSTFENWRQNYNNLATDVGMLNNLTTGNKTSIVNAINFIMDQYFFFQDFDFDGSDGATSNTVFSGNDNNGNSLSYSAGRVLVFKNGALLRNGTDYSATNGTSITLSSSASNSDVIRITAFTGSYEGVSGAGSSTSGQDSWVLEGGVLYNKNTGGLIFNADSTINNSLEHAGSIQFENEAYFKDEIYLKAQGNTPTGINFQDADNSNSVKIKAPDTISSNYTLVLPAADGSSGQFLITDGSGNLSFSTVSSTAPDITVSANNSTDETVFPLFVDGATGTQGVETDTGFTYNPSSGILTATQFTGALSGNATTATTLASSRNIGGVAFDGSANINLPGVNATGNQDTSGNAATATTLETNRDFSISGDLTASAVAFNGSGNVTLSATINDNAVDASALNISGNGSAGQAILSDGDGSFSYGAGGKTTEEIQDIVGAMFSSNTETRISATYEDGDGTIDLVVDDMTANTNTTYDLSVPSSTTAIRLAGSDSTNDDVTITGGSGISVTRNSASQLTIANSSPDQTVSISAGSNVSVSGSYPNFTIASTDTNTNTQYDLEVPDSTTTIRLAGSNSDNDDVTLTGGTGVNVDRNSGSQLTFSLDEDEIILGGSDTRVFYNSTSNGQIRFNGNGSLKGTFFSDGSFAVSDNIIAFYSFSDERLKDDIISLDDNSSLNKVLNLNPVEFKWKDGERKGQKSIGLIAQEVEKIVPEVVREQKRIADNDEAFEMFKSLDYEHLVPLLVGAIKELKSEIEELKSSNS